MEGAMQPPQFKLAASAAGAGDGAGKPVQKKDDPLKVDQGQVTFDAEGQDSGPYFSRVCHWPGGNSGVTIGRGYDLGSRTSKGVLAHLTAAGITGAQANTLATGAGLKGDPAGAWVKANKAKVGEINHEQQKLLFDIVYNELKNDVVRISSGKSAEDKYGEVDFKTLHPAIMEIVVDLRYRGDYHPKTREWIQPFMVKNDLKGFAAQISDTKWLDLGVPKDRFNRRKAFIQAALAGKTPATKPSQDAPAKDQPKKESPSSNPNGNASDKVIDSGTVSTASLNVRTGAGTTFPMAGAALTSGAKVKVYEKKDGWLRIGNGQWVSGKYVELTGKAGETQTTKPAPKPDPKPVATGTVTASSLNVRSEPNTTSKVVDTLKSGAQVTIISESDGWMQIGPDRWVSGKYVQKGAGTTPKEPAKPVAGGGGGGAEPNWLTVARGEIGTAEIKGAKHNPKVIEYHATTGKFKDDETPWCSSFANWVMKQAGKATTGNAMAMSWAKYGKKLDKPALGAIVVFSYGGGKGHVGFIVGKQGDKLQVLGGNQGDMVKISAFGTGSVAAYVVPSDYEVPASAYNLGTQGKADDSGGMAGTR
jgi:uncharacterized protein (TIGR02594 family)